MNLRRVMLIVFAVFASSISTTIVVGMFAALIVVPHYLWVFASMMVKPWTILMSAWVAVFAYVLPETLKRVFDGN